MGEKLTDSAEILFRQVHPDLMHDGVPSSSIFCPTQDDDNQLSVDRSALTNAESSHTLYTSGGRSSTAVFGITVSEFEENNISCHSDALEATDTAPANAAHALANFEMHGSSKQKAIAKKLKRAAVARGQLHPKMAPMREE